MAFSRSFKSDTWFMRLSNGEVESATGGALEQAFRCGLVGARTPVRGIGAHVWTTLGEAAALDELTSPSFSSLSPVAMDDSPPDLIDGTPWHVRNFGDARSFRTGVGRLSGIVAAGAAACVLLGVGLWRGALPSDARIAGPNAMVQSVASVGGKPAARACLDLERHSERDSERLTREQIKRLHDLDLARRLRGNDKPRAGHPTSRTPVVPEPTQLTTDPFRRSGSRFDPLNGAL